MSEMAMAPNLNLAATTLLCLFFLVVLGPYMTYKPQPFTGEGSPLRQVAYIGVFAMSIYAIRAHLAPARLLCIPLFVSLALVWCWMSLGWSNVPEIAVRRLMLTTLVIWTVFILIDLLGFMRTTNVLRIGCLLTLVLNYLVVALLPSVGIHSVGEMLDPGLIGNWRGFLQQKNFTGAVCAFTILLFLFAARHVHPFMRAGVIVAAAFFLYKTSSKTSMALLVGALAVGALYVLYDRRYKLVVLPTVMVCLLPAVMALQIYWNDLMEPFQREDALTGRVQIWPILLRYWDDNPLLGSGYGSFWNVGSDSPINRLTSSWVSQLGNGHNGYVDMLVQTGLIGVVLIVFAVIVLPIGRLIVSAQAGGQQGGLLLAIIFFCAGHNITETSLFERDTIVQVFLMFAVALAYRITDARRLADPDRPPA